MPVHDTPARPAPPRKPKAPYPAEDARGGEIILRSRMQRAIFIAGLVGAVVLALLLGLLALIR